MLIVAAAPARERINDMNAIRGQTEPSDDAILSFHVSDEALEAAARTTPNTAMTLATPTVSIFLSCCGNDYGNAPRNDGAGTPAP
jgi:hypothetical protein